MFILQNLKMRLLSSAKLYQNERGVTFVEAMVAAGIFSIAITGLSLALVHLGHSRQKVSIVNSAIALQSYIMEAISNPDSYPDDASRASIVAGSSTSLNFTLNNYKDFKGGTQSVTFSSPSWDRYFTIDLLPCAGASFADENCAIRATLGFLASSFLGADVNAGGAVVTRYSWKAAYRITINPSAKVNVGDFGAPALPFAVDDYKYALPDLSNRSVDSLTGCNPATHIAIRGVDRDTGQVYCILRPNPVDTCANGQLPRKFVLIGNRLTLDCADGNPADDIKARVFTCPTDYSLQQVREQTAFFQWYPTDLPFTTPTCVFRGASSEGSIPVAGSSASSGAPSYTINNVFATTTYPTSTITRGICPRPTGGISYRVTGTSCSATSVNSVVGGCCKVAGCTGSFINFAAPAGPSISFTQQSPNPDQITCSVTTTGYWDAQCAADQTGCPGATPAYTYGAATLSGPATCTLDTGLRPLNQPATASVP